MDARLTWLRRSVMRAPRQAFVALIGLLVALALVGTLATVPVSARAAKACRVTDRATGRTYGRLQQAVDAARSSGHRFAVKGTCHGRAVLDEDATIVGVSTRKAGGAVLDADREGAVITVREGVSVTIIDLSIREGRGRRGGGIVNRGSLVLRDVDLFRNAAKGDGGGVWNGPLGKLVLDGETSITGNRSRTQGGGVHNVGILTLNDQARISGNNSNFRGGGVSNDGAVRMNGSSVVSGNSTSLLGGGVYTWRGPVTLSGSASINANWATDGGGVYIEGGNLSLNDAAAISGNTAADDMGGGGVTQKGGVLTNVSCGLNVRANAPVDCVIAVPL